MALSNSQYDEIMRSYNQKQFQNKREQDERIREIYTKIPMIKEIDDSISTTAVKRARMMLEGQKDALESMKMEFPIESEYSGVIEKVFIKTSQQVDAGQMIAAVKTEE